MGSAFHQLCPRYSGTLAPSAPTANRLWKTFTFTFYNLTQTSFFLEDRFRRFCKKKKNLSDIPIFVQNIRGKNQHNVKTFKKKESLSSGR